MESPIDIVYGRGYGEGQRRSVVVAVIAGDGEENDEDDEDGKILSPLKLFKAGIPLWEV